MNLSAQFKEYLITQDSPSSKATIKNYLSDVNKFIKWFEAKLGKEFSPSEVNQSLIDSFKNDSLIDYSASSVDRSISTLRKFFYFLKLDGQISHSPFEESKAASAEALAKSDPWKLKDFKNHLYVFSASRLTIKNYLIDVKQFLTWVDEVVKNDDSWEITKSTNFSKINSELIEEYKERLLNEVRLSPVSVNRKLSSIRRFISWANEEGLMRGEAHVTSAPADNFGFTGIDMKSNIDEETPKIRTHSSFPPLRLLQKTKNGAVDTFDNVFTAPVSEALEKSDELVWNLKGRPVFKESLKSKFKIPNFNLIDPKKISNVPKSFYAPALISTQNFPLHRKLWHHAKHTRPNWYKRYHSYAFVTYLHFSILMLFISAMGYGIFNNFSPKQQPPTFAALPSAPPRILSFQGRLTDASDNPITKGTTLRMAIYNNQTASGSALLWQEIVSPTPDEEGIFSILLGNNAPIPQSLFAQNSGLWLGVTVERTSELTPRQQIATVAFASNAETLQGLPPITNTTATSNVVLALNSSGNLSIGGTANPVFQATGGSFTVSGRTLILTTSNNGNIQLAPSGTGIIDIQRPIQNTSNSNSIVPGSVTIEDIFAVVATSSGQAVLNLTQGSTGDLIMASTSSSTKFRVDNGGNLTTSGTINGLTVSSGTVTSGTWNGTAIGAPYGGTGQTSYAAGDMLYASDSTVISKLTIGGSGTCLTSTGTAPSWVSCVIAAGGTGFWDQTNGALYPFNSTVDLLIGGQSTTSAKFAFLNVGSGTPTASISGNSGNIALSITGTGEIQTTNGQTLTLGGNTTGFIDIDSGSGLITLSDATNINGNTSVTGTLTSSGLITANGGLTVPSGQATTLASFTSNGGILYTNGSGVIAQLTSQGSSGDCLLSTGAGAAPSFSSCPGSGSGGSKWTQGAGFLTPNNNTLDLLIGGASTDSAKFGILNVDSGTPTASISGNSGNIATTLSGLGNLQTTNGQTLTLGGTTTGNIILNPGNSNGFVGINSTSAPFPLDIRTNTNAATHVQILNTDAGNNSRAGFVAGESAVRYVKLEWVPQGESDSDLVSLNQSALLYAPSSGTNGMVLVTEHPSAPIRFGTGGVDLANERMRIDVAGRIGIGTYQGANLATLDVRNTSNTTNGGTISIASVSGATSFAALTVDNSFASGDIFTASKSGKTAFVIDRNANVGIGTATPGRPLTVFDSGATTDPQLRLGASNSYFWDIGRDNLNTGRLQFINNSGEKFSILDDGKVGIGITAPTSQLYVTRPITAQFGATGKALAIFDQTENQDIFSASASGTPKFSIGQNGEIKVGSGFLSAGNATNCLLSGGAGAAASWGSCATGVGQSNWRITGGALSPINNTLDVLVGSDATSSSKFAFLNVGSGTPTASISGNSGNIATYLTGLGQFSTTNRQSLTIGNSSTNNTTGNVLINSNGQGNVGIGTTGPISNLDLRGVNVVPANTTAGNLNIMTTNAQSQDVGGSISLGGYNDNGATAFRVFGTIEGRKENGNDSSSTGYVAFQTNNGGALSEKMRITGSGNVSIGLASSSELSKVSITDSTMNALTAGVDNLLLRVRRNDNTNGTGAGIGFTVSDSPINVGSKIVHFRDGSEDQGGLAFYTKSDNVAGDTTVERFRIANNGLFGLGTTTGNSQLYVTRPLSFGATGKALVIFDQIENQDILTASASGAPVFTLTRAGGIALGAVTNVGTGSQCLLGGSTASWGSCTTGVGQSNWRITGGALSPINNTLDVLIGGQSTASAKFAFTGLSDPNNQTQASISGNLIVMPNNGFGGNIGVGVTSLSQNYLFDASRNLNDEVGIRVLNPNTSTGAYSSLVLGSGNSTAEWGALSWVGIGQTGSNMLRVARSVTLVSGPSAAGGLVLASTSTNAPIVFGTAPDGSGVPTEKMRLTPQGTFGFGTTTPLATFDIRNSAVQLGNGATIAIASISGSTTFAALLTDNTGTGDLFTASKSGTTKFVVDNRGVTSINLVGVAQAPTQALCHSGSDVDSSTNENREIVACSGASDLAEWYEAKGEVEAGDILITSNESFTYQANQIDPYTGQVLPDKKTTTISKLEKSTSPYQPTLVGIVSESPSDILGPEVKEQATNPHPIALKGRTPVKIITENGVIHKGDPITTSSIPGVGMKATKAGLIVGTALEEYDGTGVGMINVHVNTIWTDPDVYLTDLGDLSILTIPSADPNFEVRRDGELVDRIGAFGDIFVARIKAGYLETGRITTRTLQSTSAQISELTTDSLVIGSENISIAGQSIRDYIYSIVDQRIGETEIAITSPILEADEIKPKSGKDLAVKLPARDSQFIIRNSSGSGVASIDAEGNASFSGKLTADGASISGVLRAKKIIADEIEGLNVNTSSVSANYITNNYYSNTPSASESGQWSIANGQTASGSAILGDLYAQRATFEQGIMAFGPASFFEASIADRLFVGSRLSLAEGSINVLGGNLELQPLKQGGIAFVGGQVEIDVDGNLKVDGNAYFAKDLEIKGNLFASFVSPLPGRDFVLELGSRDQESESENHNSSFVIRNSSASALLSVNNRGDLRASGSGTFNKLNLNIVNQALAVSPTEVIATGSAGTADIQPNREELTVRNPLVTGDSLIYITAKTSTSNESMYLLRQVPGQSFTVGISNPINKKVPFNWILIN